EPANSGTTRTRATAGAQSVDHSLASSQEPISPSRMAGTPGLFDLHLGDRSPRTARAAANASVEGCLLFRPANDDAQVRAIRSGDGGWRFRRRGRRGPATRRHEVFKRIEPDVGHFVVPGLHGMDGVFQIIGVR